MINAVTVVQTGLRTNLVNFFIIREVLYTQTF